MLGKKDWEMSNVIRQLCHHMYFDNGVLYYDDLMKFKVSKIKEEYDEIMSMDTLARFGDNRTDLYEGLKVVETLYTGKEKLYTDFMVTVEKYIEGIFNSRDFISKVNADCYFTDLNNIINTIKKLKRKGFHFKSINVGINGLMLKKYDDMYRDRLEKNQETCDNYEYHYNKLISYGTEISKDFFRKTLIEGRDIFKKHFKKPLGTFFNLYDMTVTYMVGGDAERLLQYYPIEKNFDGYKYGSKDYFSSKDALDELADDHETLDEYGKLTKEGARWILSEVMFTEPILFDIGVQMFYVIEYGTDIDSAELFFQFFNESKTDKKKDKSHLKVIK